MVKLSTGRRRSIGDIRGHEGRRLSGRHRYQDEIVAMAMSDRLPVISDWSAFAKASALSTYGARQAAGMRRTVYYVDRILKGAKPPICRSSSRPNSSWSSI